MGPRSENRGYRLRRSRRGRASRKLQWVHGLRTVVIHDLRRGNVTAEKASMGPRSENRGYLRLRQRQVSVRLGFNGSTV